MMKLKMPMIINGAGKAGLVLLLLSVCAAPALAEEAVPAAEQSTYVLNSLLFLISGMVVMLMAAGFCMLEVGLVRAKNAATICLKNIALYSIAGIMVWVTGYNLIYHIEPGALLATSDLFFWQPDDTGAKSAEGMAGLIEQGTNYSSHSDWYFQMVFVATAASIVSGALAERVKLWSFLLFVVVLTGFIYPVVAGWDWGGGFLEETFGFSDFAGSTLVHSTGGWAALAGVLILGPRKDKYNKGKVQPMPGSSLPLAALGVFILWFGWFGFNGGSQLAAGTVDDIISVAKVFVNTNIAAAGGVLSSMMLSSFIYRKVDLTLALNGAIGGLVSITAEPLAPAIWQALLIGGVGGSIVTFAVPLLDRYKIDDVVGAIPAHLFCGIWGTLIVPWTNHGVGFFGQLAGVLMVGIFVFTLSALVWTALKYSLGIRVSEEEERQGLDAAELGQEAWPEFTGR